MNESPSHLTRTLMVAAATIVVIAGLKAAEPMLVPFLLSVFIAMVVSPLLTWLKKNRVPGWLAITLVITLILLVGLVLGAVIGSTVADFRQDIPLYTERLTLMSSGALEWLASLGVSIDTSQWQESFDPGTAMRLVGSTLASFGNVMTNAMLILLTVVFILAEEMDFAEKLKLARGENSSSEWLSQFAASVNSYMAIKTMISLLTGLVIFVWLWILGVDYAVLWGLLAFLFNFIPTVGSIIAAVPAVLLALVQLGLLHAGLTLGGFVVVNMVMGNVIEPRWMGRGLNLSPLVVFVSLVLWGWVLGPVGMLLSIPLTIMLKIALEHNESTRWIAIMLGASAKQSADDEQETNGQVPAQKETGN